MSAREPPEAAAAGDQLDRLYRAAWALSGSSAEAAELVRDTFARAMHRPPLLHAADDPRHLLGLLRATYLARHATDRRPQPDLEAARGGGPAAVYAAIATLPRELRDTLVAVDVGGLGYRDAARLLRVRHGTLASRLFRARRQLARRLDLGG